MAAEKYEIDSIKSMLEIPSESFERFIAELPAILRAMKGMHEINKTINGNNGNFFKGAVWVDDDKRNIDMNIKVTVKQ